MKVKNLLGFLLLLAGITVQEVKAQTTYCAPAFSSGCTSDDYINSFSTTGGSTNISNNNSGCSGAAPSYIYYSTKTHTGIQGTSVSFTGQNGNFGNEYYGVWVDWNQDGDFVDAGEQVYSATSLAANANFSGSFNIPIAATTGTTRLRVMCSYAQAATPCNTGSASFGETEDYNFVVVAAVPCSARPTPGTTVASNTTPCPGTTVNLSLSGSSLNSGIAYQWKELIAGVWTPIAGATSPSYTTTGISTARTFHAVLTCTSLGLSDSSTNITVTPNNVILPYLETFESITANNQLPNCMTVFNPSYSLTYTAATGGNNQINHTTGGSKYGSFYWLGYGSPQGFVTPGINMVGGTMYEVSFWYITDGVSGWNDIGAYFGTSNTSAALTNLIGTKVTNPTNTTYQKFTGRFIAPATGTYFVGIIANYTSQPNYMSIDDISVIALPPCTGRPSVGGPLTVSNANPCLGTTVTFDYNTAATNASDLTYDWWYSPTGTAGSYTQIAGATATSYTTGPITGVGYYYARTTCTNSGLRDSTAVVTITPNVPTLPYRETFESITAANQLPNCMTALSVGSGTTTYLTNQTTFNRTNHTTGGSKFLSINYTPATSAVFTPAFNLVAGKTYEFSYWYRTGVSGGGSPGSEWTGIQSRYGTSPSLSSMFNLIGAVRTTPVNNTGYQQFLEIFTPTVSGSYFIGIIPTHSATTSSYLTIDDIELKELPPCTGTPNAGGAPIAQFSVVCPGNVTDIVPDTTAGVTYNSNVRYQWQFSRDGVTNWQNVPVGQGDTMRRYTTFPINDTTWFRVIMTCLNTPPGSNTSTSGAVRVSPSFPTLPYLETFEGITAANTLPQCMTATDLGNGVLSYIANQTSGNRTNHTTGGTKFVSINGGLATLDGIITPGFNLIAGKTYEVNFWYITGNSSNAAPSNFTSLEIRQGTTPILGSMSTIGSVRPVPVNNTTYQQYSATYKPTASGVYYFGVGAARTLVTGSYLSIDDIGVKELPDCNGAPTGGTTTASATTICPGAVTELALTGASNTGNLSVQWEQSIDNGTTWTAVTNGFGANTRYYETGAINMITQFRAALTCNGTVPATSYSAPVTITPNFPSLPYLETFEGITAADQLPGCMSATSLGSGVRTYIANQTSGNRTNHTTGGAKFASFSTTTAGTNGIYTPGMNLKGGKTYRFSFWYITGNSGTGAPTNVTSLSAYYGTQPTIAGMTSLIGSVQSSPVMNTTYQQFQETFIPAADGVYYLGIQAASTAAAGFVTIDDIGLDSLNNCTGTPDAGTIASVTPCPNVPFTLRTTGGTSRFTVAGLTYQWQDSTASGWNAASGVTATTSDYTTTITAPRTYRLIVTCGPSALADTSESIRITLAPFYNCYCTPTYATGAANSGITKVELRNLSNSSSVAYPWYSDYAPQQPSPLPIPLLTMTVADTLSVTMGGNATNYSGVWIDFNHNSVFDASEYFSNGSASTGANGVAKIGIVPPATALFGQTRMRIRSGDRAAVDASMACGPTGSAYGEAEDYYVTIQYPPCAGPVNAGTAVSSDNSTCVGYTVDLVDTTHEQRMSGTTWSWQSSDDGGLSWTPVANSTGKDTLNNVPVTGAVSYRLRMFCDNTGDSTFSVPVSITIKPPYACYCVSQSTGTSGDNSDIGAVQIGNMINNTGGPHVLNPRATRRHSFYTEIPNITLNADGSYRLSVYHIQRNAVHENARVSVFVDYNNDLVYNAAATPNSERVFTGLTSAGNFYIDTVLHVPNAVIPNAMTGMRVILNSDLDPNAPANLGCGEYLSGETEDYVVKFNRYPAGIGNAGGNIRTVSLYPNPTEGRFTVELGGTKSLGTVSVQVTTITGQSVLHRSYDAGGSRFTAELDLGDQARGIYFVEVRAGEEKVTRKLILR